MEKKKKNPDMLIKELKSQILEWEEKYKGMLQERDYWKAVTCGETSEQLGREIEALKEENRKLREEVTRSRELGPVSKRILELAGEVHELETRMASRSR